ncbi:MAG: hypothetical protein FWH41_09095, partial [Treponema sp.]|nr:hypothetical protein [Treponema sp.]
TPSFLYVFSHIFARKWRKYKGWTRSNQLLGQPQHYLSVNRRFWVFRKQYFLRPDCEKAKREIDFKTRTFEETVKGMIAWMHRENRICSTVDAAIMLLQHPLLTKVSPSQTAVLGSLTFISRIKYN